jgi:hypothetical protein
MADFDRTPKSNFQLFSCELLDKAKKELDLMGFSLSGQIPERCISYLDDLNSTHIKEEVIDISNQLFEISRKIAGVSKEIHDLKKNELNK